MPQPTTCTLMLVTRDHIHNTACPGYGDRTCYLTAHTYIKMLERGHSSAMEKAERDIRENLTGESQQGRNPYLPSEPCDRDGKPGTTNPELVLKVKIQNSKENDFIEIELHRQELSYQKLLQVSCCELGIHPDQVEKMRKLPNTLLRKDKDIQRLQDFQEIELLVKSGNSERTQQLTESPLTERPCYNSKAAKMTY